MDEKNNASTLYTRSLIMSYIQFHLTLRWNPLKTNWKQLQHTTVLEPYKNHTTKVEKLYFSTPCTPRNPIKEWLTLTPFTRKNKGKITPERRCKKKNQLSLLQQKQYQHLHRDQGSPRTSILEDPFRKPFKNSFQSFFSHRKCLIFVKTVIAQQPFHVRKTFQFIENSF